MLKFMEFETYELLKHSSRLCENIDGYVNLLGLSPVEVKNFKDDCQEIYGIISKLGQNNTNDRGLLPGPKLKILG